MERGGQERLKTAAVLVLAFMLLPYLYPLMLLTTLFHESGHALAAWLTGGRVHGIRMAANGAGVCTTSGGWPLLVASGGYIGSAIAGCLLLFVSSRPGLRRHVLEILGLLVGGIGLTLASGAFTVVFCLLTGVLLFLAGTRTSPEVEYWTLKFIGASVALYAVEDLKSLLLIELGAPAIYIGGADMSDAQVMASLTGIPALLWAAAWGGFTLWLLWKTVESTAAASAFDG